MEQAQLFMKAKEKQKKCENEGERKKMEEKKRGKRKRGRIHQIRVGVLSLILKGDFLKF